MKYTKEGLLQIAVSDFAKLHKLPFLHIANERSCSPIYGQMLKRMGVKAGVSDCFFPRGNDSSKGLWLELKIKPNKPTDSQLKFIQDMIAEGYSADIAYTIDEAIAIIKSFYSIN